MENPEYKREELDATILSHVTAKSLNTAVGQVALLAVGFFTMKLYSRWEPVVIGTFACMAVVGAIRLRWGLLAKFRPGQVVGSKGWFRFISAASGFGWGLLCAESFYLHGLFDEQSLVMLTIVAGACAAATYSLSPAVASSRRFVTSALALPVVTLVFIMPEHHLLLAFTFFCYWVFLMSQIEMQARAFWHTKNQEEHLSALDQFTLEAIFIHDQGHVLEINSAFTRMFGYSLEEAKKVFCTRFVNAEDRNFVDDWKGFALNIPTRWRGVHKNGELFHVESTGREMMYRGKKVRVVCVNDASERHKAEEAVRESARLVKETMEHREQAAIESNRLKADFLANMSHEIRTPLNAIIGITDLLTNEPMGDVQRRYYSSLRTSGELLLTIVNDVLDFSKIDAGKVELEKLPFSISSMVEAQAEFMQHRANEKSLALSTLIDPDIPALVEGDPGRIAQILVNLMSNAIKFTDEGTVFVKVFSSKKKPGDIMFEVADTGMGLSATSLAKLFQPFTQADTSTARKFGGTGLGLSICKRLVEIMGGEFHVTSEVGKGSTFAFSIPLVRINSKSIRDEYLKGSLERIKLLVLEEDERSYETLHTYFSAWKVSFERTNRLRLAEQVHAHKGFEQLVLCVASDLIDGPMLMNIADWQKSKDLKSLILSNTVGSGVPCADVEIVKPLHQSELYNLLVSLDSKTVRPKVERVEPASVEKTKTYRGMVLLAEDNLTNQMIAIAMLESLGFKSKAVLNGAEAVAALDGSEKFDFVLMDCQMPKMDGFEATRKIRSDEKLSGKHITIIALTANATPQDQTRCLESGMDDYIAKPVRKAKLDAVISKWFPVEGQKAS